MTAIFVTALIIANLIGSLLFAVEVMGVTVSLSAGIIPFPITFILTDLLNEFYGGRGARFVTYVGFAMSILVFGFLWIGTQLPVTADSAFPQAQYLQFSGLYTSMFIASLTAYLVGQLLDIGVFQALRKMTHGRFLWLRATGSTIVSQLIDSILVTFIAFSGTLTVDRIWDIALGNYTWKFLIAIGITPLLYLGHALIYRAIDRHSGQLDLTADQATPAILEHGVTSTAVGDEV
ncbi:MAG: queuosine precursor transporter [Vampirovibrio sp.]|nr:queuosine precursor transporter [Vampirovibrio sp.]